MSRLELTGNPVLSHQSSPVSGSDCFPLGPCEEDAVMKAGNGRSNAEDPGESEGKRHKELDRWWAFYLD